MGIKYKFIENNVIFITIHRYKFKFRKYKEAIHLDSINT